MQLPGLQEMEAYIRSAAQARGIDPDIAVKVARSEGLRANTWQSDLQQPYGREASYGPFQLHVAPQGRRPGMGNDFVNATGLDPADPTNWKQTIDFALDQAAKGGWSPWMGAAKVDVTGMMGINGGKALGVTPAYSAGPGRGSMAGYRAPGTMATDYVPGPEKTFYADNSPALPRGGAGTAMGGFSGGPTQVAARNPGGILPAVANGTGNFRPSNFQQMAARQADEGDQSQRARLLQAAGLDPTGKKRIAPRGENGPSIMQSLKTAFPNAQAPSSTPEGSGLLAQIFKNLFA